MKQELEQAMAAAVQAILGIDATIELTRPDPQFGDYATNVALQLAKQAGKNPREIAESLVVQLRDTCGDTLAEASVAGPGFINLRLSDTVLRAEVQKILAQGTDYGRSDRFQGQSIVAEYSDPNPFKVLHAGHLYTSVVGDAIANLYASAGGNVHRVNFGGDVGMHVGKTLYAIVRFYSEDMDEDAAWETMQKLADQPLSERSAFMAARYVEGTNAYEDDETAKQQIVAINKRVYAVHDSDDHETAFAQIYWTCRQWSYNYFDEFYARIGTKFEKYYPESQTAGLGLQTVRQHIPAVFQESDGAVVFRGENFGLHTRVFINSEGIPTYEAKDVGLIMKKWADYQFDRSIIITGNDQLQYMEVIFKAVSQFAPDLIARSSHLTHGIIKLSGGTKMSSRKGNFLRAVDVLDAAAEANQAATGGDDERIVLGAVKYAFLKQRIGGGDIIYDPEESVSLQGNSGPYLQYAHARASSILRKASVVTAGLSDADFTEGEQTLVRKLREYPEVVALALQECMPHHICTYLYELSQTFNRFYENNRVIGDERQSDRLVMVQAYQMILASGLGLLGIDAPDSM